MNAMDPKSAAPLLEVENLCTQFTMRAGVVPAVDSVSFTLNRGEVLGVVGESGCGKSVMALSVLRLIPDPPGQIVGGSVRFEGVDLLDLTEEEMRGIRGNDISMIFQEPMTSLHPILKIGRQLTETLMLHQNLSNSDALDRAVEMLRFVRIPEPEQRVHEYPHQLSGGMRQRVMIAMALSCSPKLLIADEPTTALDVTIQAQILTLMRELQEKLGMAVMLITHDMGVVAENAHRVIVMYAGKVVEQAGVGDLFAAPLHPYTRGLLTSIPRLNRSDPSDAAGARLSEIPGIVPSLIELPRGCAFAPRCRHAVDRCRQETPRLEEKRAGHWTACWESDRLLAEVG